jgi:hypothetical protein
MGHVLAARLRLAAALLAGAGIAMPRAAAAQIVGLPVPFSPSAEEGLRLFGDFALGDSPVRVYAGGRALLNLSYASVGFMAGDRGRADPAWGGNLALNLVRGSARSYSLSVEGGYGDNGIQEGGVEVDVRDIPIGVGLALEVDKPGLVLEPWAGLRAHVRRSDIPGAAPETNVGLGISAGLNLTTRALTKVGIPLPGFGVHLSADYLNIPRPFASGRSGSLLVNVGLNYLFEIKGLPRHGIIPRRCDPTDPTC